MLNIWELPTSISVNGRDYNIRTDYRAVLDVLTAFSDRETEGDSPEETAYIRACIMLDIMMLDEYPQEDLQGIIDALSEFIDMGMTEDDFSDKKHPKLMDWEQDAPLIIPAINRVIGHEVRAEKYMHWWTFLSAYMEIGECSFSSILEIRTKKAKGKKLEKWEEEYIRENKSLVLLHDKLTDDEKLVQQEELDALKQLLG